MLSQFCFNMTKSFSLHLNAKKNVFVNRKWSRLNRNKEHYQRRAVPFIRYHYGGNHTCDKTVCFTFCHNITKYMNRNYKATKIYIPRKNKSHNHYIQKIMRDTAFTNEQNTH